MLDAQSQPMWTPSKPHQAENAWPKIVIMNYYDVYFSVHAIFKADISGAS